MKHPVKKGMALVAVIAASWCAGPAFSARVLSNTVVGTVSGVSGNQIVVDGKSYSVKIDGPALRQLQRVQLGSQVDLMLNGSPQSAASQVVGIHVREPHQTAGQVRQ
jgi:hypothetical protein